MRCCRDYCIHDGYSLPLVSLTNEEKQQAYHFADNLQNLDYRAKFAGGNPAKVRADHASGKLAEFGAAKYLAKHHHLPLLQPDLEIRSWHDREDILFDADFAYEVDGKPLHVHVKSVRASFVTRWEESYNVHMVDNTYANPSSHDWLCLVVVDDGGAWVKVRGLVRAGYVQRQALWGMPRKSRLEGTTRYLYWQELELATR